MCNTLCITQYVQHGIGRQPFFSITERVCGTELAGLAGNSPSLGSDRLNEIPHVVVISQSEKMQDPALRAEKQPETQASPTFKIVTPEPPHSKADVTMRLPEEVGHGVNCASDFASTPLW